MTIPASFHELDQIYHRTLEAGVRSLAICSAESGEGVTSLVEALARRHQSMGYPTLVVELNNYHRNFSLRFANNPSCALPALAQTIPGLVLPDELQGVSLLPAPLDDDSTLIQLQQSHFIRQSLETWLQHFHAVIFDTVPLNAQNRRNIPASKVASVCDASILVVAAARTREVAIRDACKKLHDAKANLVGTVINERDFPRLAYELKRETYRLDKWFPGLMASLRQKISDSRFLNPV